MGEIQIRGHIDWDILSTGRVVIFNRCFAMFLEVVIHEIKCDRWSSLQIIFFEKKDFLFPAVVQLRYQKSYSLLIS